MRTARNLCRTVGVLVLTLVVGCAPAYHSYSGCSVNCRYCTPPPLPYTSYHGCACHSYAASSHLAAGRQRITPQLEQAGGDVGDEASDAAVD